MINTQNTSDEDFASIIDATNFLGVGEVKIRPL